MVTVTKKENKQTKKPSSAWKLMWNGKGGDSVQNDSKAGEAVPQQAHTSHW